MIVQEYLKIIRRRGLFLTAIILPTLVALAITIISLRLHSSNPAKYDGGQDLLVDFREFLVLVSLILAILMGAQAGAWDFGHGTFRYLAMTGRPRVELYLVRLPALIAAILTFVTPAIVISLAASAALPLDGAQAVDGHAVADFVWTILLVLFTYALISFAIGALLRSSGAAIGVALGMNLVGFGILAAIAGLNDTLGDLILPNVVERLTGSETSISIPVAVLALLVWIGGLLVAGAARTIRTET